MKESAGRVTPCAPQADYSNGAHGVTRPAVSGGSASPTLPAMLQNRCSRTPLPRGERGLPLKLFDGIVCLRGRKPSHQTTALPAFIAASPARAGWTTMSVGSTPCFSHVAPGTIPLQPQDSPLGAFLKALRKAEIDCILSVGFTDAVC